MADKATAADACYIVPRRVIQGSTGEMLDEIDDAIRALIALRHLIAIRQGSAGRPSDRGPGL